MAAKDTYREQQKTVESGVSTNFQSMGLEIDVINNLKKSVEVYHQNYEAMLQAYTLGKETMTDVQNALTTYYSQKSTLVQAEYSFLTSYVTFKQQVGDLSMKDITEINNWMHKHVQS
jgi:outer membrane protein